MPENENKNTGKRANNGKSTRFTSETGKAAGKKSGKTRRYMSSARNALKAACTDDELRTIITKLIERGKQGNLTAIKMIFEYTEEQNKLENEIKLIIESGKNFDEWSS